MDDPHFSNIELTSDFTYFLFVGELKAYGLNHFVAQALERKFDTPFKAISIAPDLIDPAPFENLMVISPNARKRADEAGHDIAFRIPMKDFSATVSGTACVNRLIDELLTRQDHVYIWMFESRPELALARRDNVSLLGPDADMIEKLNDKTWQYETFSQVAPTVDFKICCGTDALEQGLKDLGCRCRNGMFVSASHSAGGASSMVCQCPEEALERFTCPETHYLISGYMPHEYDPTVLAVVGSATEVYVAGVADMNIVDGNKFRGSTFPSVLPSHVQQELREYTAAVGRELGKRGFKGIYGCDYIVTEDEDIYFIEVNPRKQGTTMEYCSALERLLPEGAPSLFDMECHAVLHGGLPDDIVVPDFEAIISGNLHWGTFNHKVEEDVVTAAPLTQDAPERKLFEQTANNGLHGHVILEHAGDGVLVKAGTFLGRVAAVAATRTEMLRELEKGTMRLADSIASAKTTGTDMDFELDGFTTDLLEQISGNGTAAEADSAEFQKLFDEAKAGNGTAPIVTFFRALKDAKADGGPGYEAYGFTRAQLIELCAKHVEIDEHCVTIGGRVGRALEIIEEAGLRVKDYLARKDTEAPSGIQLWEKIEENKARIMSALSMSEDAWNSFGGQLGNCIDDAETLQKCLDLPDDCVRDVARITKQYRMRMTPYYASLIQPVPNDPVLLQAVPTGEMVDTVGEEIPPVASDHSPVRLVDQFYPRVVALKSTNICAMYCTHCLRIAHIGGTDHIFSKKAYQEALDYIAASPAIRDVLITGGDAFMLSNEYLRWLLEKLDAIPHIRMKRLGTRVPVTTPQRVDVELLDILEESNDRKPVRVVTQINTAQEITPVSKQAFKDISKRVFAVLNQAVLMRGINDSKVKMWHLCETIQESYVRPYYIFNCSYRNPQYYHMRVPVSVGRDIVEGMYGNISGDAIPRYIAAAGGKIPLHRDNLTGREDGAVILTKPWGGEVRYPDANPVTYGDDTDFAFNKYGK